MSLTSTHSLTVWMARMPQPRLATSSPRPAKTLASQPPPVARVRNVRRTRQPALDHPEVGRRLVVDAAEPHTSDGLSRHLDGADALLGTDAGVGLETVHDEVHVIRGRRAGDQLVDAVAVEDQPAPGGQTRDV